MTKIKNTLSLAEEILTPLIKWCQDNPGNLGKGGYTRVQQIYNDGLAEKVPMSTIARWLIADRSKAVEPKGGALLRLCEVWRVIRQPDVMGTPQTSIYCAVNGHTPSRGKLCPRCDVPY